MSLLFHFSTSAPLYSRAPCPLSQIIGSWDRSFAGGKNLSSPLARAVSSQQLAHNFMSFFTSYSDTGLWGCYATCEAEKLDDFSYELQKEWMRICTVCACVCVCVCVFGCGLNMLYGCVCACVCAYVHLCVLYVLYQLMISLGCDFLDCSP